jgi:hypothetical protein
MVPAIMLPKDTSTAVEIPPVREVLKGEYPVQRTYRIERTCAERSEFERLGGPVQLSAHFPLSSFQDYLTVDEATQLRDALDVHIAYAREQEGAQR